MQYTPLIQKAVKFATKTHEVYQKQKRKGKDVPYIVHPLAVGLILARAGASDEVVAAGILHDTIEDSVAEKRVTKEMLAERFGEQVAALVDSVTEQDKNLSWEERKSQALEHVPQMSHNALLVKSADLISNVSEMIADYKDNGEVLFEHFNAPQGNIIAHYLRMQQAVIDAWPENPLADDLKALDIMSMDPHKKGLVMVSFSGEEYLQLADIVKTFISPGTADIPPKLVLVMGGTAAGKTTIRRQEYAEGYVNFEYGEIYTAVEKVVGRDHPRLRVYSMFVSQYILRSALEEKKNIAVEIIGDNYDKLRPVIDAMENAGYHVEIVGITADVAESYQRHLKAVKEDTDYLSCFFTQDATLSFFYSYFDLPNSPAVAEIPKR